MSERYGNGWAYARPTGLREATSDDQVREIPASRLLREPPRRNWMVENVFLRSTVAMITGDGGKGKCVGRGTPILMFNGEVRNAEEIKEGDSLMGPDSRPRKVRSLTSGTGPLFRVTPTKGDPYVVNGNHVLSLKMLAKSRQCQFDFPVNLTVNQYLSLPKEKRRALMGWRSAGVEWLHQPVEISPYLLGLWLGDGTAGFPEITSANPEIVVPELEAFAEGTSLRLVCRDTGHQGIARSYRLSGQKHHPNPLTEALRAYGIYKHKAIPSEYLANSSQVRLDLLAGLLDTDGHLESGCYEIIQKSKILADQILFIARSLGFAAYSKISMKKSQVSELRPYYRIHISGDVSKIPVRLPHKKAAIRRQKKNVLVTSINVEPIGEGEYFGWEVDSDHLFLLGDFTVTHNSLLMQQLCTSAVLGFDWLGMKLQRGKALFFACEDDGDELHRRQWAINAALGCSMEDVCDAGLELIPRVGQDNALMTLDRKNWRMRKADTGLLDALVSRCATHGIQYLIVDTATKTFRGNQNDDTMVDDYITEFRRIAVMMQGIVIFTKHPSMNGRALGTGESGSVAWVNSVRAFLYLHTDKTEGLVLEGRKANYGPNAPKIPLVWKDGAFKVNVPQIVPRWVTD